MVAVAGARDVDFDHFADTAGVGIEHEDAVAEEDGFIEVVGDEDDGDVDIFPDVEEVGLHLAAGLGIEGAEGFVHEEDAGLIGESAGDGDALFHAAGELLGVGGFEFGEADEFDPLAGFTCVRHRP